jgi:hypothetical protein
MRGSPRISGLRPTFPGTMGTPTPACGWRITGSRATREGRQTTSSSSRTCRSTSVTLHGHGSSTCAEARSATRPTYTEFSSATSRARTPALASSGSCETASKSWGKACASISNASPSVAPSFPAQQTTTPSRCSRTTQPTFP